MDSTPAYILIVEDEPKLAALLGDYLKAAGHETAWIANGLDVIPAIRAREPDLVLLDLMLPGLSGYDICRKVRQHKPNLPIIMLTAKGQEIDKVAGLDLGADDYVTKPFHREELVARIHAVVRRSKGHSQSVIRTGKLTVNLDAKTVEVDSARVHLTGKEYAMLELLSLRKGTTLTKEMFLNHLYGGMDEPELKIIDVFICKLRKKLAHACGGANYIETVWGRGYVLRDPDERAEAA